MNNSPLETSRPRASRAPRTILVNLVIRVLRPLARLMLRHGITLYEFIEIARWVFAHAAMDGNRFSVRSRDAWSMSKSRCAVLTGMTRRQVDRQIRLAEPATEDARRTYHRGVRVLAAWAAEDEYRDELGLRGELPLRGSRRSFEQLVRIHCRDISMRSMLDELLSRGCVLRTSRDTIRFVHDDLDAMPPFRCNIQQLEQSAEDFMQLLERTLENRQVDPLLHVVSPPLTHEEHEILQLRLRMHMQSFIGEVQREFAAGSRPLQPDQGDTFVAAVFCTKR